MHIKNPRPGERGARRKKLEALTPGASPEEQFGLPYGKTRSLSRDRAKVAGILSKADHFSMIVTLRYIKRFVESVQFLPVSDLKPEIVIVSVTW